MRAVLGILRKEPMILAHGRHPIPLHRGTHLLANRGFLTIRREVLHVDLASGLQELTVIALACTKRNKCLHAGYSVLSIEQSLLAS